MLQNTRRPHFRGHLSLWKSRVRSIFWRDKGGMKKLTQRVSYKKRMSAMWPELTYAARFAKWAKLSTSPVFWIMYLSCKKRLHFDHALDLKVSPAGLYNHNSKVNNAGVTFPLSRECNGCPCRRKRRSRVLIYLENWENHSEVEWNEIQLIWVTTDNKNLVNLYNNDSQN